MQFPYPSFPLHTVPRISFPFSIPFHSIQLHSTPFHCTPFQTTSFHFTPYHSTSFRYVPIHSIRKDAIQCNPFLGFV